MMRKSFFCVLCASVSLLAFGLSSNLLAEANEPKSADVIAAALSRADRSPTDKQADVYRHPDATLHFFNARPGQVVLDFFAGGGYYSELLAHIVGTQGRVDAYNNRNYLDWVGRDLDARTRNQRLPNVRRIESAVADLQLKANEYDAIYLIMALHDIYYADPANNWPLTDRPLLLQKLRSALKPNGILAIVDHHAGQDKAASDAMSLHRIEERFLIKELEGQGFVLDARSEALRNLKDSRQLSSFDPAIRYQTDRFMLRMRKSAK